MTHYHARKIIKTPTVYVDDILSNIKQKCDAAVRSQNGASVDFSNSTNARLSIDNAMKAEVSKLQQSCVEIMSKCSGFNLVNELHISIEQLEKEMEKMKILKLLKMRRSILI